jgi:hypothetical protein
MKVLKTLTIMFVIVFLLLSTSFCSIYLYKNHHLNFLRPLYYDLLPSDDPLLDVEEDNLALFNDIQETEPIMRMEIENKNIFLEWQENARNKFKELLGIKEKTSLDKKGIKIISKEELGDGVERLEIIYLSKDEIEIPCYLFLHEDRKENTNTENKKLRPGILLIPGHGNIEQTAGLVKTDAGYYELKYNKGYQNANAEFLAKQGYVTLTCENRGQGKLSRLNTHVIMANALSIGRTYQGVLLNDHMAEITLLQSLNSVDDDKIGVAGVSLGGEQALYLGAIDERVKATVSMGWISSHKILIYPNIDIDWIIPNLITYFDQESIGALIAPRAALFSNGAEEIKKGPGWFNSELAIETTNEVKKAYDLFEQEDKVSYIEHPGSHTFDNEVALKFFNEHLS